MFLPRIKLVALVGALVLAVAAAGCNRTTSNDSGNTNNEDAWVALFKKELAATEQRFFEARYIQKADDPFYLKEILPRVAPGRALSRELKSQIQLHRADYSDSWPLLSDQLERTQLIFAVTSVVPAFNATVLLARVLPGGLDTENAASILAFKALVEQHAIFDGESQRLELAPEARNNVVELANKIAARALTLMASASVDSVTAKQLQTLKSEIRLLNVKAAEQAGQPVSAATEPFIEDPMKSWESLHGIYERIFGALDSVEKAQGVRDDLAKPHTRRETRALRGQLDSLTGEASSKLEEIPSLQASEKELLDKLVFATEKQFSVAKIITAAE